MILRGLTAVALASALTSMTCGPAVKHPAITAGIVSGVIGFGACEMEGSPTGTCGLIGGGAGVFLGGIAALVLLLFPPGEHQILSGEPEPEQVYGRRARLLDAGVAPTPPIDAAPAPAPIDAGMVADATVAD
jgi:hypothetical protein